MASLNAEQIREQVEFDRLMVAARAQKMRGDLVEAEKALLKALAMRFDDLNARELAADILYDRGEFEKAAKHYKSLYSPERPRPSAESGFARCVLKMAEIAQQREALLNPMDSPISFVPERRTPIVAAMLSIAPGLGQVYCGQFIKGLLLFAAWLFFLLLVYASQPRSVGSAANTRLVFGTAGIMFICLAVFVHAYAIVDAVMTAEKTVRRVAKKKEE
jgi:tetratricopeptide (TPR) repeat protein